MNIWLITIGEPIFHPENKLRLHRTGILAQYISKNTDHKVTWWTSTFNHFTKKHDYNENTFLDVNPNLKMIALKGKGYARNVSFDRIIDHGQIAKLFNKLALDQPKPDIIVAAFPTLGLSEAALAYGKKHRIPVVIDYRDMWPEAYIDIIPSPLKIFGKILLYPLFKATKKAFNSADGLIGITDDFLTLALNKVNRGKGENDGVFPLGYLKGQYNEEDLAGARDFWKKQGIIKDEKIKICFFGAIGYQSNWQTIIDALHLLAKKKSNVEFIICGSGDKLPELKAKTEGLDNVKYPGFISAAQIKALMEISDIGLCAYFPKEAYLNSIPGKPIEYMSNGLPILSTLSDGTLGKLINKYQTGYHYQHDSSDSLVSAIETIENNMELVRSKKDQILKVYDELFDADVVYSNYTKYLEEVKNKFS